MIETVNGLVGGFDHYACVECLVRNFALSNTDRGVRISTTSGLAYLLFVFVLLTLEKE